MADVVISTVSPSKANPAFKIAHLQLHAPKSLNALTLDMIQLAKKSLESWAMDPTIACVFLDGAGDRAFCAGGDVAKIHQLMKESREKKQDPIPSCRKYFESEYDLDYYVHTYPKPIVVWGDGYVMGGGLGLMNGAAHRIVTEKSVLSMPEINIGLYPDVGASYFLSHMPGKLGLFLGLTAARIRGEDAIYCGLADIYYKSANKQKLFDALLHIDFTKEHDTKIAITHTIQDLASIAPESQLATLQERIDSLMAQDNVQDLVKSFLAERFGPEEKLLLTAQDSLRRGSPTSAAVIFEQLRRSQGISLEDAFAQELTMSLQFSARHDFPEGVRALLIDKDNNPQWVPHDIDKVKASDVDAHFLPV